MINEKDKLSKQEILRQGQQGDFWKLIVQVMQESKETLRQQQDGIDLKELPADQYKFENELLKAKIKFLDKLIDSPEVLIQWLQNPDSSRQNFDPYE